YVPQHAAWEAAVVATGLSGHDQRAYHLEIVSGRGAAARVRSESVRQLAVFLGLLGRQCVREHVSSGFVLVQGDEAADSQDRQYGGRRLSVEGWTRGAGHHERRHGTTGRDSVHL